MTTPVQDKYFLKSLHEEIDLFDRKLAHVQKYDTFASEAERTASVGKLAAKRDLLARTARRLVSEGVQFNTADLPRSFRPGDAPAQVAEALAPVSGDVQAPVMRQVAAREFPSPFAGTALDGRTVIQEYKEKRRSKAAQPGA